MSNEILGIDFGTTNTLCARWMADKTMPRTLRLGRSGDRVPTAIHVDEGGQRVFGEDADDQAELDPGGYLRRIKRDIGLGQTHTLHGREHSMVDLVGAFLEHVTREAVDRGLHTKPVKTTIAVPAFYGRAQRAEFKEAAGRAGLGEFELLDEPVAAGMAYCHDRPGEAGKRILVFDWGGGTLDLALVEHEGENFKPVPELVSGDDRLGGEDLDDLLLEEAGRRMSEAGMGSLTELDGFDEVKVLRGVRRFKEDHSRRDEVSWRFVLPGAGEPLSWKWTRAEFEEAVRDPLEKAVKHLGTLVEKCREAGKDPDFVLLVGGSSEIPMVKRQIEEEFDLDVRMWEHSGDAVALGAAISANRGLATERKTEAEKRKAAADERRAAANRAEKQAAADRAAAQKASPKNSKREKTFVNGLGMEMIWVPAGSFRMGDLTGNGEPDERPVRTVELSGYFLGATQLMQGQWKAVTGNNPSVFPKYIDRFLWYREPQVDGSCLPVESVSWDDAMEYCRKLTAKERKAGRLPEGYEYTLPTEAQWENACRAGTEGDYAGDLDAMAWYGKRSGRTCQVATKIPNAWGFYDMHGNVWEWCWDCYDDYDAGDTDNPEGPDSGSLRVRRGGGWIGHADNCRSAIRCGSPPDSRISYLGFRVALSSRREP